MNEIVLRCVSRAGSKELEAGVGSNRPGKWFFMLALKWEFDRFESGF
jgi:hypothetical protein